jgi:hypothetical protein
MTETLQSQFASKKPEMQLISGALRGLSSFLVHFGGEFTALAKNLQQLYKYVTLALQPLPDAKRYNIPKGTRRLDDGVLTAAVAGLKLLATHAAVLRQYLTEFSEQVYNLIAPLCQHQNKKLRDHALAALDAFLSQVSSELVSTQRDPASNRDTFKVQPRLYSHRSKPNRVFDL